MDPKVEKEQIASLHKMMRERNKKKAEDTLDKLRHAAEKDENLMPTIIDAVKAYATLGEIHDVLRQVYGEYKELIVI